MSVPISFDASYLSPDVTPEEVYSWQDAVDTCHAQLHAKTGQGGGFLGWMNPNDMTSEAEVKKITEVAQRLRDESDVLVVIGIGGSYLGARAVIEALCGQGVHKVAFAGNDISAHHYRELLGQLEGNRVAVNVISKSGTTLEPAIGFRVLWHFLQREMGRETASQLITVTTDPVRGALRKMAEQEGYETFAVPEDVGGRYSVLSPVGLLPIAYLGIDIGTLLESASACAKACENPDLHKNPAYYYAVARNLLYNKGKQIEVLAPFLIRLHYFTEWWKQLFGESEGKENEGIFPAAVTYTTDLHSMGQWMQQGRRNIFETFIDVEAGEPDLAVPEGPTTADELGYLTGKQIHQVNREAYRATALAHREGGVPSATVRLPKLDEETLGGLLFFFEKACAMSGYLLRVNPFDQPGVEAYKEHMFSLLGRPGNEEGEKRLERLFETETIENILTFES